MFKKIVGLITTVILTFSLLVSVSAGNSPRVYSDSIKCDAGEVISIPVYIENNPGIMGFKISVDYPAEAFKTPIVTIGTVTKNGSFNDSIKSTTNGSFDVLWSSTADVSGDGTLFTVEMKVKDSTSDGKYIIGISYSQADTFNEKWQDVKLVCSGVEVIVGDYVEPEEQPMTFLDSIFAFFRRLFEIVASWFA